MSLQEKIIKQIVKSVKTDEPLYKITYILPQLEEDVDNDEYMTINCSKIKSVIWNKSTFLQNHNNWDGKDNEWLEEQWLKIIDPKPYDHRIEDFGMDRIHYTRQIMLYKLSVELLN